MKGLTVTQKKQQKKQKTNKQTYVIKKIVYQI